MFQECILLTSSCTSIWRLCARLENAFALTCTFTIGLLRSASQSAEGGEGGQRQPYPVFLGFVVAAGALEMAYGCIKGARLPLVLDLDETVVKAYTAGKITDTIAELNVQKAALQDHPEWVPPPFNAAQVAGYIYFLARATKAFVHVL
jgi:hypothetical protein